MSEARTEATPGPWTVYEFVGNAIDGDKTEAGVYEVEEANEEINDLIACGEYEKARQRAAANKARISAAPAMHAAIVSAVQRMEADPGADQFLLRSFREALRQAAPKATGGQP